MDAIMKRSDFMFAAFENTYELKRLDVCSPAVNLELCEV